MQRISFFIEWDLELNSLRVCTILADSLFEPLIFWIFVYLKNQVSEVIVGLADFPEKLLAKIDTDPVLLVFITIFLRDQTVSGFAICGALLDSSPQSLFAVTFQVRGLVDLV